MPIVKSPSAAGITAALMQTVAPVRKQGGPRPTYQKSHPKMNFASAWLLWQSEPESAGSEFLWSLTSWLEGTAAQLLRQPWPIGARRATSPGVQQRLCANLDTIANGDAITYIAALEMARSRVVDELRVARDHALVAEAG